MAKNISNALFWIIAIIAILSFLGVVYLIVKDAVEDSDLETVLVGQAIAPSIADSPPSKILSCNWADDRNCEDGLTSGQVSGNNCRSRGYTGGSRCTVVGKCSCYSHSV